MDLDLSTPEALSQLIISGEAQQIYLAIETQAEICLDLLLKSEQNSEIDINKTQSLRRQIRENLEEASNLRFTLNTTDKKLLHEQSSNPVFKKMCTMLESAGKERNMGNFVDCLGDLDSRQAASKLSDPLSTVRTLVTESLQHRIQMAWCFDEILETHRSALIANMINIAHRLTEVALLLQDSQAIQEVRTMLRSLNLDVSAKVRVPNISASPTELKQMLKEGITAMHQTFQDIERLDEQRKEMKKAVKQLNEKLGENAPEKPVQPSKPKKAVPPREEPKPEKGKGMVFPSSRKKDR